MSGPKILWYGKSILDCGLWPWLVCVIKGSWPIMSNFWGPFFHFFEKKNFSEKPFFLGLKLEWNLSVNTERSGTDYCWLYCGRNHGEMYAKFGKKKDWQFAAHWFMNSTPLATVVSVRTLLAIYNTLFE